MEPFDETIPQAEPELNAQIPEAAEVPQEIPSAETPAALPEAAAPQDIPAGEAVPQPEPAQENAGQEKQKNEGSFFNDLMDLLESVIVSIFVVMLVFTFLFCTADVEGTSMVPTLEDHDRLLVNRIDKDYERGDILIIDSDKARLLDESGNVYERDGLKKRIVKRLIAKGGQQVDIDFTQGIVYVDGEALTEPYINNLTTRDNFAFTYPVTVPEGYIFVLGDNRSVSRDSRDEMVGLIPEENIVGKVILRISPFSSFGKVR
ncbi:MAG: signal peptidase I [Oscillospiraceae bacterium]|nr:signal peptidase I [Oscillospiraceae bacterium]